MNTVKFDEAVKSSSSDGLADGNAPKVIVVDVSDALSVFEWANQDVQDNIQFEDVVSQALSRRFDRLSRDFDQWLLAMRYLLSMYLRGDDLEEGIARLETVIDILVDKLSCMRAYQAGKIQYRYLLKKDRLYLLRPEIYRVIVLDEASDAPF